MKIEIFIPLKPGSKDQPNVIGRFIGRDGQNVSRENSFLKFVYILKPFSVVLLPFTFMQERISKLFTIISCVPWFFFPQKRNESKVCYPYIIVVISIWSNYDILSSLTLCPQIILGKGESQNHTFSVFWAFSWVLKGQYFMEICICICNIPIFFLSV